MKLNVLDYGLIDKNRTTQEALDETIELAQKAEALGYHRFWVAEHHNIAAFAISSPELMMMELGMKTSRIRLGSGGIMALHYSAYKVAEIIKTLEARYPNRIDLGVGNFLGNPLVQSALKSIHTKDDYPQVIRDLDAYLHHDKENPLPIAVNPKIDTEPELWTLSHSEETAQLAAELGLGYVFGIFPYMPLNTMEEAKKVSAIYHQNFKPSSQGSQPHLTLASFIVIADTAEEAEAMAKTLDIWMLGNDSFNEFTQYPDTDDASAYPLTQDQKELIKDNRTRAIIGDKETVKKQLDVLIEATQASEVLVIPLVPGLKQRIRSLELMAELYL
ncbi:LLM class flavin-dependent oxidoreductase [Streptococcus dysgalactiae]|uniref:LLM class flavin-dependent oxidoreductase n=1 Tax=Streptococcus dysgalactiae TaxID=1334 RepID=UPI003FD81DB7